MNAMLLLCPACHAPLGQAVGGDAVVTCGACGLEVDLSRLGTVAGKPRFVPERDWTGQIVGGYVVGGRLGAGGMGQVYRARGAEGDTVAIKFLAASLAADPELRARFEREVKLLEGLDHPAIVRVRAAGESAGVPWFAMTLVEGPSLRTRLADGPLALGDARVIFARIFAALAHAHARGVVHRDLKPANVLLASDGALLADFGIARPEALVSAVTRLTETAAILGTVPYMSPEQRAGAALDRRSDLFSVGVMLYEALTGTLPQGAFAPPARVRPELPARLDAVVLRLLQPAPADRYASAEEAGAALAAALAPPWRPSRRVLLASGGGATALAALALAIGFLPARVDSKVVKPAVLATQAPATAAAPIPAPAPVLDKTPPSKATPVTRPRPRKVVAKPKASKSNLGKRPAGKADLAPPARK